MFSYADNEQVVLLWTPPASNGGAPITDYVVQFSSDGGSTWTTFVRAGPQYTGTATAAIVTGLTNGTPYVFRVAAVNSVGTGPYLTTPSSVTPVAPVIAPSLWKVETYSPVYHWSI
jgi:titin